MDKAEFDKFAEEYQEIHKANIRISGESPEFFCEYKIKDVCELLADKVGRSYRILDFGAGVGGSIPCFRKYFPHASLTCLDVSEKSQAVARARFPESLDYQLFDGSHLPFSEAKFDLVFAACVFHHIPEATHGVLLKEWLRVLKPGGVAVIFEHNPLNPLTLRAVNTCPFDVNAKLISAGLMQKTMLESGFCQARLRYRLFVPGIIRALRPIERWLYWCPLGAQYFVYAIKPE
jgi:ubiquinone/menaquinone biosynthesis C-methylase UbiE